MLFGRLQVPPLLLLLQRWPHWTLALQLRPLLPLLRPYQALLLMPLSLLRLLLASPLPLLLSPLLPPPSTPLPAR